METGKTALERISSKVIFTLGPSSESVSILRRMAALPNAAVAFRINTSHTDISKLSYWLTLLSNLRNEIGNNFEIILDLQGAKARIGDYPATESLPEQVTLFLGEKSSEIGRIPVPLESVFSKTKVGDKLFINDKKVILSVEAKTTDTLSCKVEKNGYVASFKGINSPDRVFELARITSKDKEAIEVSRLIDNLSYAISFVADGNENEMFRPFTANHRLVAKIEQLKAFENLETIAAKFDELWLCRGDLGAEAGLKKLGSLQRMFVSKISALKKQCILAGEVLGSTVWATQPSRGEIVQLDNALCEGFSGFVLSDETACGNNVEALLKFLENWFADE